MTRQTVNIDHVVACLCNGSRKASTAVLAAAQLALLAACAGTMPSGYDSDPSADLSGYRTFQWISDDPLIAPEGGNAQISAINRKRIVDAIEAELFRKGYAKAESRDAADFALAFTVGKRDRIDLHSYPLAYRTAWYWHPYFWEVEHMATTYTEGRLSIDIFDQRTRQPVWNGWAKKRITSTDVKDPTPAIHEAVAAIFSHFPPGQVSSQQ